MRLGVLTGGGDCPGLNPAIRALVRAGIAAGDEMVGFREGWRGLLDDLPQALDVDGVAGILTRGGTILGSSRTNPFKDEDGALRALATFKAHRLDGLIAIGGDDTLGAAERLYREHGLPVLGLPKTIDNDLGATDVTFGFDTAVQIATDAIDRLHTTAESHRRNIVIEVMGRNAGWIALYAGMAGGADVILIPEVPFDIAWVCELIAKRHARGRNFSIIAVAEGAKPIAGTLSTQNTLVDDFGHERLGGIAYTLEAELVERTGIDTRSIVLGHLQRGGTATAFDRVLATRLGLRVLAAAHERDFGKMAALRSTRMEMVSLAEAVANPKLVPLADYQAAALLFG
jgi:6-phosphofructokinase 1